MRKRITKRSTEPYQTKLARALELGYVVQGWTLEDYIRDSIEHYGWESIVIWGSKGSGKSNFLLQIGYMVYQDWDKVLSHIVFSPMDFIRITKEPGRIPWLGWDDIAAYLPRSLYFTNRALWSAFKQNWDTFRTKLNSFVCTSPLKSKIASFVLEDLSGEIFMNRRVGDNLSTVYDFQRWMWSLDFTNPLKEHFDIIRVDKNLLPFTPEVSGHLKTRLPGVPTKVFKVYWKKRMDLAEESRTKLHAIVQKLEMKAAIEEPEPVPQSQASQAGRLLVQIREAKKKKAM